LAELGQMCVVLLVVGALSFAINRAFNVRADTVIALGLGSIGVLALIYANHQFRVARNTIDQLNGVVCELTSIRSQLTTERLQNFSHFMSQVVTVIKTAKRTITIFCDYPIYGSLINPAGYEEYIDAINLTEAHIRLVCLNEWRRSQLARERLDAPTFEALRRNPRMREFVETYQVGGTVLPRTTVLESMTPEQFVMILEEANKLALRRHFVRGGARQAWETDLFMPLFFWIADDSEAVFALVPHAELLEHPLAFRTRDPLLVGALGTVFDGYIRVRSSTEKLDDHRIGIVSFAGGLHEWRALLRSARHWENAAVRLRDEIEAWVAPRRPGGG
jgi:hypothetical protein